MASCAPGREHLSRILAAAPDFPNWKESPAMLSQPEKARIFRALHERGGAFLIPNPWDRGTARLLQKMGFEAIATSSAGFAYSQGKPDTAVGRDAMLSHVADLASAVDLPVSGDLENGYGDTPEVAAETIRLAAAA